MKDTKKKSNSLIFDKPAYDIKGLLELVPISRGSIYNEIKAGRLRICKMRRKTLFLAKDISAWLESLQSS